jgi:hypothetical protein
LENVEQRRFLRGEAHAEEPGRRSVDSSVPHVFNTSLTYI